MKHTLSFSADAEYQILLRMFLYHFQLLCHFTLMNERMIPSSRLGMVSTRNTILTQSHTLNKASSSLLAMSTCFQAFGNSGVQDVSANRRAKSFVKQRMLSVKPLKMNSAKSGSFSSADSCHPFDNMSPIEIPPRKDSRFLQDKNQNSIPAGQRLRAVTHQTRCDASK